MGGMVDGLFELARWGGASRKIRRPTRCSIPSSLPPVHALTAGASFYSASFATAEFVDYTFVFH